jgi:hypothetical protein
MATKHVLVVYSVIAVLSMAIAVARQTSVEQDVCRRMVHVVTYRQA